MKSAEIAYAAGVVDSDGCITIKRRRTPTGWTYAPVVFVRQVERGAVELLARLFGGRIRVHGPSVPGGNDLNHWEITHHKALYAAKALLPFLRIKHRQARILLDFGKHMGNHRLRRQIAWFKPLAGEAVYTPAEAAATKNIDRESVYQAIRNGSVPCIRRGRTLFVARRFWDSYQVVQGQQPLPPEYLELRERFVAEIRSLNGPTRGVTATDRRNSVTLPVA